MDSSEFDRWLDAHSGAFPGFRRYLSNEPGALAALTECLSDIEFRDAREASRTLNRADAMEPPPFGEHGRLVRRMARKLSADREKATARYAEPAREHRYSCRTCWDSGLVIVANIYVSARGSAPISKFLSGATSSLPVCSLYCSCPAGRGRNPQYDARVMFPIDGATATADECDRFRTWWSEGRYRGNRESAFDRFNAGESV